MSRAMKNAMRSGPRKVTMAGIEWTEQYGIYRAVLNGWMESVLSYAPEGGYYVRVASRVLEARPHTADAAAILARAKAFAMAREIVELLKGAE